MTAAPHRLRLSAGEYAYLVERLGLSMPPGWEADERTAADPGDLAERGVLPDDLATVHPSVALNLRILGAPTVMVDTTVTIGGSALHGLHALAGPLGASLFALEDGAVELSLFEAVDLGRELARAVPPDEDAPASMSIMSRLDAGDPPEPPRGEVPLSALHELGAAELLRGADPDAPAAVLRRLALPAPEAELATRVASRTDGTLVSLVTARTGDTGTVLWLHTDAGWSGLRPLARHEGRAMMYLEPVARTDLGVWAAPYIAAALEVTSVG